MMSHTFPKQEQVAICPTYRKRYMRNMILLFALLPFLFVGYAQTLGALSAVFLYVLWFHIIKKHYTMSFSAIYYTETLVYTVSARREEALLLQHSDITCFSFHQPPARFKWKRGFYTIHGCRRGKSVLIALPCKRYKEEDVLALLARCQQTNPRIINDIHNKRRANFLANRKER